jgi:chemotaxis protein MotD
MTRVDVQTIAPPRAGTGAAPAEGATGEAAAGAFERCFPAPGDKNGRGAGGARKGAEPDPTMLVEAQGDAQPMAKGLTALNALVFDLGRGAPPIREPGLSLDPNAAAADAPPGDALAGLLAQALGAVSPAQPGQKRATGDADGQAPRAAPLLPVDGEAAGEPAGPQLPPLRAPGPRFPGAADLALAVKAVEGEVPMKATVLSQATHFAPVLGAANVQAIANAVSSAASDRGALSFAPALASGDPLSRGSASPVKMLTIQLEPISLGKVTLAIRLTGDGVRVDVMAADPKVVPLLNQDKEQIMDAIRRSGVVPDVVTIQAGDPPARLQAPGVQAQSGGDAGASSPGGGGREGAAGGSERRDNQGQGAQHARRAADEDELARRRDGRGDLYL